MSGDKTEKPTHHKLKKLREEGQVPPSKNVVEAALVIFAISMLTLLAPKFVALFCALLADGLNMVASPEVTLSATAADAVRSIMLLLALFVGTCSAITFLVSLLMTRFNVAPKALTPKFTKFNPINQIKSIFSKNNFYNFLRILMLFSAVSAISFFFIVDNIQNSIYSGQCGAYCIAPFFMILLRRIVVSIMIVFAIIAALDFFVQKKLFQSQNKMSKDEVKRDHKDHEGHPELKSNRKSLALQDAVAPLLEDSTHIVYNDDVLIAIIYYGTTKQLPYTVAKARGPRVRATLNKLAERPGIGFYYMPTEAAELFRLGRPGNFLPAVSARWMAKVIEEQNRREAPEFASFPVSGKPAG